MINHERALRIVLNDNSDFETMPRNISDITIHHRNIQTLLIELFKIKHDLAPPIMDSSVKQENYCYNFKNLQEFHPERKRTVFYGLETISYRAPNYGQFCRNSLNKETQPFFSKVMSDNRFSMSVYGYCAKYMYQTQCLFEIQLLTWYLIIVMDCSSACIYIRLALQRDTCPIGNTLVFVVI